MPKQHTNSIRFEQQCSLQMECPLSWLLNKNNAKLYRTCEFDRSSNKECKRTNRLYNNIQRTKL